MFNRWGKKEDDSINQNCESCIDNYFLINATNYSSNCVEKCPEELKTEGKFCLENKSIEPIPNVDPNQKKRKEKKVSYIILIVIIIGIIILIIFIYIRKKKYARNTVEEIINDINRELKEDNNNSLD